MSHLLPDSRTMRGFDPAYFEVLPEARMHLDRNKTRLVDLRSELEQSINERNGRNSDVIQAEITELEEENADLQKRLMASPSAALSPTRRLNRAQGTES